MNGGRNQKGEGQSLKNTVGMISNYNYVKTMN
jgi:hypothetical protein